MTTITKREDEVKTTIKIEKWVCAACNHEDRMYDSANYHYLTTHIQSQVLQFHGESHTIYWLDNVEHWSVLSAWLARRTGRAPYGAFYSSGWYVAHHHRQVRMVDDDYGRAEEDKYATVQMVAGWLDDIEKEIAEKMGIVRELRSFLAKSR